MPFSVRNPYLSNSVKSIKEHVSRKYKFRLVYLSMLLFTTAVFDVVGLAFILPVLSAATNKDAIFQDKILSAVYTYLGFQNPDYFLLFLISALLVIFILKSAWGILVSYLQTRLIADMALAISRDQFYKYLSLPYPLFQNLKSSEIIRDIVTNPNSYIHWVILSMITVFTESVIVMLIITGIAVYNWKLFIFIALIIIPASAVVSRIIRRKSEATGEGINTYFPLALAAAGQAINGYTDIKLTQKEAYHINRFSEVNKMYLWNALKQVFMNNIPFRTNEVIALLGMIVILVYGLFFTENRNEIVTIIGLFAAASYRLMPSLNRIVNSLNFINVNQVSIDNLNRYIEYFQFANKNKLQQIPVTFQNTIEFRNITFEFPDSEKPVLENISLVVKKGEKVGFIGKSGSGKTTLMNILLRFYIQQSGKLLVDDIEITEFNITNWRSKIGYVKQVIFLMDASIKDNITFGDDNPDEARLKLAIEQASLSDWINSLPDGINTLVGEKGSRLSGGQKQRVGIARSLYRNADVLIFDEATSALDIKTEQEVTDAIDRLSNTNKTIFIIAHRITTLKSCDRIYELENGSIAGIHRYKDLIEKVI